MFVCSLTFKKINNMTLISVIIPVYNVETYLRKCVDSVLSQSYNCFEILLIDDGSTDSSGKLCDELVKMDGRIKAFHKLNGGLSSARNYGVEKARGEYIIFLDSDDYWLDINILSLFIDKAKNFDLDIVRGEYISINMARNKVYTPNVDDNKMKFKDVIFTSYEMMEFVIAGQYFSWLFFIKKTSLGDLRFDENRKFQEDIDFAARLFTRTLLCGYLPIHFYAYCHRQNSIITTPRLVNILDSFSLCDVFYNCSIVIENEKLKHYYIKTAVMMYYWTLKTVASDAFIKRKKEVRKAVHIEKIRKKVYRWSKQTKEIKYPFILYIPSLWSIYVFRIRWAIGKILRNLYLIK